MMAAMTPSEREIGSTPNYSVVTRAGLRWCKGSMPWESRCRPKRNTENFDPLRESKD